MSDPHYALSRHADLKHRAQGDVLVLPERAIQLSGSGGEILALCDGTRTRDEIVRVLAERYPGTAGLAEEVERFLAEMSGLGGLALVDGEATSGGARA